MLLHTCCSGTFCTPHVDVQPHIMNQNDIRGENNYFMFDFAKTLAETPSTSNSRSSRLHARYLVPHTLGGFLAVFAIHRNRPPPPSHFAQTRCTGQDSQIKTTTLDTPMSEHPSTACLTIPPKSAPSQPSNLPPHTNSLNTRPACEEHRRCYPPSPCMSSLSMCTSLAASSPPLDKGRRTPSTRSSGPPYGAAQKKRSRPLTT